MGQLMIARLRVVISDGDLAYARIKTHLAYSMVRAQLSSQECEIDFHVSLK
jgi:hypothetical protein